MSLELVQKEREFIKHHAEGSKATKKFREWLAEQVSPDGKKMTQAEAAKRTGISEEMFSRYLNGEHLPGLKKARAITTLTNGLIHAYDWLSTTD